MSSRSRAIDEIEERLQDLGDALREAGYPEIACELEEQALDFTEPTRVRRSVNAIRARLEHWRREGGELPDTAKVSFAANRLEDACRDALSGGVIAAAPATLAAQSRRKLAIVLVTLLCGGLALLIPIALVRAGIDFNDLGEERVIGPFRVPRGEEDRIEVAALREALLPELVTGVEFEPTGGCAKPLRGGATCAAAPPRLWPQGRLPTYEIKLQNQAYGLLFSPADARLVAGRVAEATLLLAATDDTPEGRYEIPVTATYLGYTPQHCELLQRLRGACPSPRIGKGERHVGVPVPVVIVEVMPGDPTRRLGEKRLAQAEAAEARRKAEARAAQLGEAVTEINAILGETEKLLKRKRFEEVSERVRKLGALFEPLDVIALGPGQTALVPAEVSVSRGRFEALRDALHAFEDDIFERTFAVVTADSNRRVAEERLLARIARQFRVAPAYVEAIYTGRADEIQERLEARAQQHLEKLKAEQTALERRCGPLPMQAWDAVDRYMQERYAEPHVEIELGECLTPRLTEHDCWRLHCKFARKVEVAIERPKVVSKHEASFQIVQNRVVGHQLE